MPESDRPYEINDVARLTGLSTARLRAWERRYEVVRPVRQPNGYRAYTGEQVALLRALGRLVAAGHRIGDLVALPRAEVLAAAEARYSVESPIGPLLDAAQRMDLALLGPILAQELSRRGIPGFVDDILGPLAQAVGDLWALGKLSVGSEHLVSEVVVSRLKGALRRRRGPVLLAACLPGERHEWGLLGALLRAQEEGWSVLYLGPDLPLDEVVDAAWALGPSGVALSAADARNARGWLGEMRELPARLPPRTRLAVGGRGLVAHGGELEKAGWGLGAGSWELGAGRMAPSS